MSTQLKKIYTQLNVQDRSHPVYHKTESGKASFYQYNKDLINFRLAEISLQIIFISL